jgi:hypothetical protein
MVCATWVAAGLLRVYNSLQFQVTKWPAGKAFYAISRPNVRATNRNALTTSPAGIEHERVKGARRRNWRR